MNKAPVIALSLLVVAALVFSFVVYRTSGEKEKLLALCEEENKALNHRLSRKAEETAASEAQLIEKANVRISELEKAMESTRQDRLDLDEAFRKLRVEADEKRSEIESLKQDLASKEALLREAREKYEKDLGEVKTESVETNKLVAILKEELSEKEASFDKTIEEQERKIVALKKEVTQKEKEIAETREKLEQELHVLQKDIAKEKGELERLRKSIAVLEGDLEACKHIISDLGQDLRDGKAEAAIKDKLIANLKDELHVKETSFAKTIEEQERKIVALKEEVTQKEKRLAQAREKLEQELAGLQKEISREKEELAMVRKSLLDLKGEKESLEHRLAQTKSTHTSMLAGLEQEIRNKEVTIQELKEKFSINFVDQVLFESGRTTLTPRGKEILSKVSGVLKAAESRYIRVVGHTDDKPIMPEYQYKFPSNWELSAARAAMVVRFFQHEMGLDPANMEAVGRSFYEPVASNETEQGRALNRRVNIVIAPRIE